jgi:RHS repeat-associated protein
MSMLRPGGGSEGDSGDPYDGYDRFSRVQEMRWQSSSTGTPIDAWQWGFNEASNRTWKKNLVAAMGEDEAYAYDGLYQMKRDAVGTLNTNRTAIGGAPKEDETFTYDPTGNWLGYRKDANGSTVIDQARSNNQDNQLTQIDGSSEGIEYDRAGNAIKIRPGAGGDWNKHFTLVWDAWNRLVEVKDENGVPVQKNAYDGLSRRITKEAGGTVTHTFWSDRWKPLEERIGSATTAARSYLWGERPGHRDELVLRDRDTDGNGTLDERLYATMDYFNGTAIFSTSGTVLERYAYSAFGVRRIMAADFSPRTSSSYAWDFGFQGQFRDVETGWYNYGYRFYVPLLGRWINRDPITERGGRNLFRFARNCGINIVDLLGLDPPSAGNGCCGPQMTPYDKALYCCVDGEIISNQETEIAQVCIREAQLPGGAIGAYFGLFHMWITSSGGELGLGPMNGGTPGAEDGSAGNNPFNETSVNDHGNESQAEGSKCFDVEVNKCCIRKLKEGGTGQSCADKNCNEWTYENVKKCGGNLTNVTEWVRDNTEYRPILTIPSFPRM